MATSEQQQQDRRKSADGVPTALVPPALIQHEIDAVVVADQCAAVLTAVAVVGQKPDHPIAAAVVAAVVVVTWPVAVEREVAREPHFYRRFPRCI